MKLSFLPSVLFSQGQKQFTKGDSLKFSDGSSKLLSGHKFQDKYVSLNAEKLLLYRDIKVSKLLFSTESTATASCKHTGDRGGFSFSFPPFFFLFFFTQTRRVS